MNEYEIIPFPAGLGACWLLAEVTTPTFDDPPKERTFADLGWSADGTRERYRHVGTFDFLDEARIAVEAMNAAIVEPAERSRGISPTFSSRRSSPARRRAAFLTPDPGSGRERSTNDGSSGSATT